ncbi:MAG: hypothetical protein K8I00_10360, partial [Candidatus Omnitrophica bacterium]|nr:hypothetical protein [Candidatus Omnitrophota bacterium]
GAYLPKFAGGSVGEGGVDQFLQAHLLTHLDPMSVSGYVTMFTQLMGTFSPVEWVLMFSGFIILAMRRDNRTLALLLIWIVIPMFIFGQLAFFVYRFLLLTVVALVIAEAVAVAEFCRRRKWLGMAVLGVALWGILWNAVPYYRMFQYRHHNAVLVDFFRWVNSVTEENAYVIERDHSAWVTYYARRQFLGVDRSSQHGVNQFQSQVDALLDQGIPVYITKHGLLDRTDIFRRALIHRYRLDYVGSRMIEDWHLGCLRQVIVPNDLLRIRAREN